LINGKSLVAALHPAGVWGHATCLPVPLSKWCAMPPEERERYLAHLNAFRGPSKPPLTAPELPFLGDEAPAGQSTGWVNYDAEGTAALLHAMQLYYGQLEALLLPHGGTSEHLHATNVAPELSAILVQLRSAAMRCGPDAARRLLEGLSRSDGSYGLAAPLVRTVSRSGVDATTISAVAIWSLLGVRPHGDATESSIARLGALLGHLNREGWPSVVHDVEWQFFLWDEALGRPPTLKTLHESLAADQAFQDRLNDHAEKLVAQGRAEDAEEVQDARRVHEAFCTARKQCVGFICADPDAYVNPDEYLDSATSMLTAPPLAFEYTGEIAPIVDEIERDGYYVYLGRVLTDGASPPGALAGRPDIDRELAFDALAEQTVVDVLFSPIDWTRSEHDVALAKIALGEDRPLTRLTRVSGKR
jgi:hypothetical protein